MLAAVLFGLFLVVLLLGVPIGFSMGFLTIAAFEVGNGPLITLAQKMYAGINNFTYLAIPLFIFAAEIMSRCGLTMSIVKLCDALVGHIRGGLHMSTFWAVCCLPVFPVLLPPMPPVWVRSRSK